jgi:hypothetical protein
LDPEGDFTAEDAEIAETRPRGEFLKFFQAFNFYSFYSLCVLCDLCGEMSSPSF